MHENSPTFQGVLPKRAGTGTERGQPCPRSGNLEIPVRIAHERARGQGCPRSVPFGQQALKGWAIIASSLRDDPSGIGRGRLRYVSAETGASKFLNSHRDDGGLAGEDACATWALPPSPMPAQS